eukprot:TRINITY_DN1633_c0_g1_i4.p1 TRINITY_DN1633_c0_g1~~TRINITY_DN1633_c0_g1_i4.p1  ORF type:complete len:609 (+),score=84.83 TRINITY_DN1633_c0_g1_i4:221-1828(+)
MKDFQNLPQRSGFARKFPNEGKPTVKFMMSHRKRTVYNLQVQFDYLWKNLPENAKIHVDKNHLKSENPTDQLFLRITKGYLTAIRLFLPNTALLQDNDDVICLGPSKIQKVGSQHSDIFSKDTSVSKPLLSPLMPSSQLASPPAWKLLDSKPIVINLVDDEEIHDSPYSETPLDKSSRIDLSKCSPLRDIDVDNLLSSGTADLPIQIETEFSLLDSSPLETLQAEERVSQSRLERAEDEFSQTRCEHSEERISQIYRGAAEWVDHDAAINENQIKILHGKTDTLGSGTFAKVYRAVYQDEEVAAKMFNESSLKLIRNEAIIMRTLSHTNIVKIIGLLKNTIVMELCSLGNLFTLLHSESSSRRSSTSSTRSKILQHREEIIAGVVKAIAYCHKANVVHADLSSMNILVDSKWNAKVSDFGLSSLNVRSIKARNLGSCRWRAPEMFTNSKSQVECTAQIDIFSIGMIIWELFHLSLPWSGLLDKDVEKKVLTGKRPEISKECTAKWKELMHRCWKEDPEDRPTSADIAVYLNLSND